METMTMRPPDRFLVFDEVEVFRTKAGVPIPFRIRVWRGMDGHRERMPFVLVSRVMSGDVLFPPPSMFTNMVANFVLSAILHYPPFPFLGYFEDDNCAADSGGPILQCVFDHFGHGCRGRLSVIKAEHRPWEILEHTLRQKIER